MTATEKLREMLDERGIEYEQSCIEGIAEYTHVTKWKMQTGNKCTFYEIEDGYPPYFTRMFIEAPTAAQAIDATVCCDASEREAYEMAYDMLSRNYDAACEHIRYQRNSITDMHGEVMREYEARMALQREYNNQCERIRNQRKNLTEMQAALERKTCHDLGDERVFHCSECGFGLSDVYLSDEDYLLDDKGEEMKPWPPFCPNCGRKVVE